MNDGKFVKRNTAIEGSIAYFLSIVFGFLIALLFVPFNGLSGDNENAGIVIALIRQTIISAGYVGISITFNKILGSKPHFGFSKPSKRSVWVVPLVFLISFFGFEGLTLSFTYLLISNGFPAVPSIDFANPVSIALRSVHIIMIAPVCEEFLMRGTVLSSLMCSTDEMKSGTRMGVIVFLNGLLFMLLHMNPLQTVYQLCFGIVLAYMTIKFGSIIPAVVMHIINNTIGVIVSVPAIDAWVTSWVYSCFSTVMGSILFVSISVVLAAIAFFAAVLVIRSNASGGLTVSTVESNFDGGFRAVTDDNGRLLAGLLFGAGAVICFSAYLVTLIAGFM